MKKNLKDFFADLGGWFKSSKNDGEQKEVGNIFKQEFEEMKKELAPVWNEFLKQLRENPADAEVVERDVECLSKSELVKIAKENLVSGADGIAAVKVKKDETTTIFLANCCNRALLPIKDNKYVRIKTVELSSSVVDLFGNEECIILN